MATELTAPPLNAQELNALKASELTYPPIDAEELKAMKGGKCVCIYKG